MNIRDPDFVGFAHTHSFNTVQNSQCAMSKPLLTIDESKALSNCNRKQRSVMYNMLESVPDHLNRDDMSFFELEGIEHGAIRLHMRVVSDSGLLSDRIHLIVNSDGEISMVDTESDIDFYDVCNTVSKMKTMLQHYIKGMGR